MNLFANKKEAWIMAGVAAFFVLVALAFTFEPLVTIILSTRTMPSETKDYLTPALAGNLKADFFDGVMSTVPPTHAWAENAAFLNKIKSLVLGLNITSATVQTNSVVIDAANDPDQVTNDIRRFLSKLTPFEIKTILPDQTSMIETVIDPGMIEIKTNDAKNATIWTFTQTNPQLVVKKSGLNSIIYINYPQAVDSHGFESPSGCYVAGNGIKTVTFEPMRRTLISSILSSFSAYFRHYSCFQSFSTFIK